MVIVGRCDVNEIFWVCLK